MTRNINVHKRPISSTQWIEGYTVERSIKHRTSRLSQRVSDYLATRPDIDVHITDIASDLNLRRQQVMDAVTNLINRNHLDIERVVRGSVVRYHPKHTTMDAYLKVKEEEAKGFKEQKSTNDTVYFEVVTVTKNGTYVMKGDDNSVKFFTERTDV